jgi:anti-sigma factor RsiW
MACDRALLVQAYVDGELDPAAALEIESHLAGCADCRALAAATGAMHGAMGAPPRRHTAPPNLERRILRALDDVDRQSNTAPSLAARLGRFLGARRQWFAGAASGVAFAGAVAVAVVLSLPEAGDDHVVDELAGAHLLDVGSSDSQTVAPWFKGRVDVSPPVADLSAQGFELMGGRADYVDGKRVAAIVYGEGSHIINLFVWAAYEDEPSGVAERNGYHLFMWSSHGLVFCAVSDTSASDLKKFSRLVTPAVATTED